VTARIVGFVSREDAGLRPPKSVSRNVSPEEGGLALHHGGSEQPAAEPGADHSLCVAAWRAWQRHHQVNRGWDDIAYTGGFCNHGYAFAGRGYGVRTAANGTNAGNQRYLAVVWIGGSGQRLTALAIDALEWWVHTLRKRGAALGVKPHSWFRATSCPGSVLINQAKRLNGTALQPAPTPASSGDDDMDDLPVLRRNHSGQAVKNLQGLLLAAGESLAVDGAFGPTTERVLREWQASSRAPGGVDGIAGPGTWGRLLGLR
jgi:hypothetical protein